MCYFWWIRYSSIWNKLFIAFDLFDMLSLSSAILYTISTKIYFIKILTEFNKINKNKQTISNKGGRVETQHCICKRFQAICFFIWRIDLDILYHYQVMYLNIHRSHNLNIMSLFLKFKEGIPPPLASAVICSSK